MNEIKAFYYLEKNRTSQSAASTKNSKPKARVNRLKTNAAIQPVGEMEDALE